MIKITYVLPNGVHAAEHIPDDGHELGIRIKRLWRRRIEARAVLIGAEPGDDDSDVVGAVERRDVPEFNLETRRWYRWWYFYDAELSDSGELGGTTPSVWHSSNKIEPNPEIDDSV